MYKNTRNQPGQKRKIDMTQVCKICNHNKRLDIDRMLVEGKSLRTIAKQFDVTPSSLHNHKNNHLSHQLIVAYEKKEVANGDELLQKIDRLVSKAAKIFHRNFEQGKDMTALKALSEQRNTFELLAKLQAEMYRVKLLEAEQNSELSIINSDGEMERKINRLSKEEQKAYFNILQKMENNFDGNCLPEQKTDVHDLFTNEGLSNLTDKEVDLLLELIDKASGKHKKLIRWSKGEDGKPDKKKATNKFSRSKPAKPESKKDIWDQPFTPKPNILYDE